MIIFLLIAAMFSTGCAFLFASLVGELTVWVALFSLILGSYTAARGCRSLFTASPELRFLNRANSDAAVLELVLFVFVLYVAARHFLWLLFPMDFNIATLSLNNFGDLPLHLNYLKQFAAVPQFPPMNPSFASEPLLYPFGADLFNALLEKIGMITTAHLFIVGMVSTLASLILLRAFAGWWGVGAFFLNGGLAGWTVFSKIAPHELQSAVAWKNLFLAVFLTQRGMLFALPSGLLLLHLMQKHLSGKITLRGHELTMLGLVWGVLPLFHLHAFFIVSILLAGYALIEKGRAGLKILFYSRLFAFAVVPATYFVVRSSRSGSAAKVIHWDLAWTAKPAELIHFLLLNYGFWLLVPLATYISFKYSQSKWPRGMGQRVRAELSLYTVLFVLFFNLMLAPWAWDNIKLLIWPYLGFARLANLYIEPYFDKIVSGVKLGFLRVLVAVVLLFSGFLALMDSVRSPSSRAVILYQKGDLASTEGALSHVPKTAVFAAAMTPQHSLTYFGRLRAVGYEGHLWSHAIDSSRAIELVKKVLRGAPDWREAATELKITHIFWGPAERSEFGEGVKPWKSELKDISRVAGFEIYEFQAQPR